jgi:hypothetical protein
MAEAGNKIATSDKRPVIDDMLLKGMPPKRIARYMREMYNEQFTEKTISDYRDNFFRSEKGIVHQLIQASQDLADKEQPATSDREILSQYFSFKQTHGDLGMIYERIRVLQELAVKYPFDDSYDERIVKLLNQAENIRTRVFRHQYENIRRSILLKVGKKIVMAAINVFLPYIQAEKRREAVERFEAIVKPLLGLTAVPDEPADISALKEEMNQASSEPAPPVGPVDLDLGDDPPAGTGDLDGTQV